MKKYINTLILGAILSFSSCVEHEVIPPPNPKVELDCSFTAVIDSQEVSFDSSGDGFVCESTQEKNILPAPQPSSVKYFSTLRSTVNMTMIQLNYGRLLFQPKDDSQTPTIDEFESFFLSESKPDYSKNAHNGVEILYRTQNGEVWRSIENDSLGPQTFEFTSFNLETDPEAEYMKYTAIFSCYLYLFEPEDTDYEEPLDTMRLENGIYQNHVKR